MYLVKTDSLGNIQWAKTYGGNGSDVGMAVVQTSDSGYLLGGFTQSFGGSGGDGYVVKTDSSGNIQWSKLYTGLDDDAIYDVKELSSHTGYVLTGATNSYPPNSYNIFLIKTDLSGDIVWSNAYGLSTVTYDWGFSLEVNSKDEILLCGSNGPPGELYGCLLCIDTSGSVEWSKRYGFGSPSHAQLRAINQTSDHGYVLAGNSGLYTFGNERMYIIKTDSLGNSGCYDQNLSYAAIPLSITAMDVTSQNSSGGAAIAVSPLSLFTVVTDSTLCYTTTGINMPDEKSDALLICNPNPFTESTTIQINSEEIYSELVIYDLFGQKINTIHTPDKKIKFDRNNLPAGLYFICLVQNSQTVAVSKLIISGE